MRPTWERYTVLSHCIHNLSVRDRRTIFTIAKTGAMTPDVFLPHYGMTFGEFAVWYIIADNRRVAPTKAAPSRPS